jgi:hypothetical protein
VGKIDKIVRLAEAYYRHSSLYSFSDLRHNMALRIFHSLLPTFLSKTEPEYTALDTQGRMAFDLIPGAKEMLKYGVAAIVLEMEAYRSNLATAAKEALASGDYKRTLDIAHQWTSQKNIKLWGQITLRLLQLEEHIKKVERQGFGSISDAKYLASLLSIIDSLTHHTGSFIERLVEQENRPNTNRQHRINELLTMRDISELAPEHTIALMRRYLPDMPKEYRDAYKEYVRLNPRGEYSLAVEALKRQQEYRYQGGDDVATLRQPTKGMEDDPLQRLQEHPEESTLPKKTPPPPPRPKAKTYPTEYA